MEEEDNENSSGTRWERDLSALFKQTDEFLESLSGNHVQRLNTDENNSLENNVMLGNEDEIHTDGADARSEESQSTIEYYQSAPESNDGSDVENHNNHSEPSAVEEEGEQEVNDSVPIDDLDDQAVVHINETESSSVVAVESNNSINYNLNSGNQQNDDDDIVFVGQILNDNPVVIDLCDLSPIHTTPLRRQGRSMSRGVRNTYRSRSPISSEIVDLSSYSPVTEPPILKCPICLEICIKNQPTSTSCGHIFCKGCITQCIFITKKCPICKKHQTQKNLHPIYL